MTNTYDKATNRLISHSDTAAPTRALAYDSRGNVTALGTEIFSYDASDQPVEMLGDTLATFVYDGHKRRVKAVIDGKSR